MGSDFEIWASQYEENMLMTASFILLSASLLQYFFLQVLYEGSESLEYIC